MGPHSRAKLLVLAVEVGGRVSWRAPVREEVPLLKRRAEHLETPVGSDAWMCCCEGGGLITVELVR